MPPSGAIAAASSKALIRGEHRMAIRTRLRDFIDLARLRFSNKVIAQESGLTVQQLKKLRCWKGKNLPLDLIEKLCQFLIEHQIGDWRALPGALFEFEDPDLFSTLVRLKEVITINGVRHDLGVGDFQAYQDSQLLGNLIHRLTMKGMRQVPVMDQVPIDTWPISKGWDFDVISKRALAKYAELQKDRRNSLHAFVGTIKSNPAIEPVIVSCFKNAVPFNSEDQVTLPGHRPCPVFMCYRKEDKQPPSAISGKKLSAGFEEVSPVSITRTTTECGSIFRTTSTTMPPSCSIALMRLGTRSTW